MKRILPLILCLALALPLAACGEGDGNTLFDKASPWTSVMTFYYFDGESGWSDWISDEDTEKELLAELAKVRAKPVENFSSDKVTYPMYGVSIGTADGLGLSMLWTNGYLITRYGEVYKFDYDFGKTIDSLDWGNEWTQSPSYSSHRDISHVSGMPNVRWLALEDGKWNVAYLKPAAKLSAPANVSMELAEWTDESVTVSFLNNSGEEWGYGRDFSLQVLMDGTWYIVPQTPNENWGFTSDLLIVESGKTKSENYYLSSYGDLPAGHYRLVVEGLSVEHDIE